MAGIQGEHGRAIELADRAIQIRPDAAWPHYNKGMSLAAEGRVDEAVSSLRQAERNMDRGDTWGRSVAIFGQGHVLATVGRCEEARQPFERYASLVQPLDELAAQDARRRAQACEVIQQQQRTAGAPQAPAPQGN
jgi:tetratricopeptide (TPR) repeat protein